MFRRRRWTVGLPRSWWGWAGASRCSPSGRSRSSPVQINKAKKIHRCEVRFAYFKQPFLFPTLRSLLTPLPPPPPSTPYQLFFLPALKGKCNYLLLECWSEYLPLVPAEWVEGPGHRVVRGQLSEPLRVVEALQTPALPTQTNIMMMFVFVTLMMIWWQWFKSMCRQWPLLEKVIWWGRFASKTSKNFVSYAWILP